MKVASHFSLSINAVLTLFVMSRLSVFGLQFPPKKVEPELFVYRCWRLPYQFAHKSRFLVF